jgi:hypothetical protein
MRSFNFKLTPFVLLFALTACVSAFGQAAPAPAGPDWETLRPDGEEFSVLMPKGSTFETSKEPYHKMELSTRTYLHNSKPGPVFAVVSLSGIKSNPALYTEMQRINSYVDAFKTLFSPKVRKDMVAKLTLVGDKTLAGNAGREYRMTIGDLSGTAQVFATRKRFYSIVFLNTKKDDKIQDEFLSSFVLPEKMEAPATTASAPAVEAPPTTAGGDAAKTKTSPNEEPKPDAAQSAANDPGKHGPVSAGVLNGKAIVMPRPNSPADADGVVIIQVLVDEQGNVTEARAISGPKQLQEASVNAALQAKFSPTLLSGEPVKVSGVLVYNFGKPQS